MTTVLPLLKLTPFRSQFDRSRHNLLHISQTKFGSPLPSPSSSSFVSYPHEVETSLGCASSHPQQPLLDNNTELSSTAAECEEASVTAVIGWPCRQADVDRGHEEMVVNCQTRLVDTIPSQAQVDSTIKPDPRSIGKGMIAASNEDHSHNKSQKEFARDRKRTKDDLPRDQGPVSGAAHREGAIEPFPDLIVEPSQSGPVGAFTPLVGSRHRPRVSDTSSAFVHSMKTASMSNASFSVVHRSSRFGRSSDSQSFNVPSRLSTESDRSVMTVFQNDIALARVVRRKQIINELIETEESYVADLKALLYLYSTLLATNASVPDTTRTAIQSNVADLLQLHEGVLDKLRLANLRAAARKWANASSPGKRGRIRHIRFQSIGPHPGEVHSNLERPCRTSLDSSYTPRDDDKMKTTEAAAADVLDITAIFEASLASLFVYEEYCANHEVLTHEFQKQAPSVWSTYEAGLESLARVLNSIDQKSRQDKKGLTVGDLLIKPIQRICRYPLLLNDLLRHTPIADCSGAHQALESVLQRLRDIVGMVNMVTDDVDARMQIQKRVTLRSHLNMEAAGLCPKTLREWGWIHLCGVLHVTYRNSRGVHGCYALCVLFNSHLLIALPNRSPGKFHIFAVIGLDDSHLTRSDNGNGLQCPSALFTFKLCFIVEGSLYEILLSACTAMEERQWAFGLQGGFQPQDPGATFTPASASQLLLDLKPVATTVASEIPLSRQTSIQRAATVGSRPAICQVILRNTHNPQDLQEYRHASSTTFGRSLSHATSVKTVVLSPKRSDRAKLEAALNNVWTKDKLPYPGIIVSKSSQILRASAGTLVRKLSLASIHAPFSKKAADATVTSKKSFDFLTERLKDPPSFRIRRQSFDDPVPIRPARPEDVPELDTMNHVIGRMIGGATVGAKRLSFSNGDKSTPKQGKNGRKMPSCPIGPEDPAASFYEENEKPEQTIYYTKTNTLGEVQGAGSGLPHKEFGWGKSISKLKVLKSGGLRGILHSSK